MNKLTYEKRCAVVCCLVDGMSVRVTVLQDDTDQFWSDASQTSLAAVWDNAEDDAYAQLLEE